MNLLTRLSRIRFSPDAPLWSRAATMAFGVGAMFGIFDILILIAIVLGGRYQRCSKSSHELCDYVLLLVTYPLGAGIMGAILGALNPLCRRLWLAIPVGIVAAVPWFALIAVTNVKTLAHWRAEDYWLVGICSAMMGPVIGYAIWKVLQKRYLASRFRNAASPASDT